MEMMHGRVRIVLDTIDEDRRNAVATALVNVMGIAQTLSRKITGAGTVALLDNLTLLQATAILAEMGPVLVAGATLRLEAEDGAPMARLAWPTPPTVAGRAVDDYSDELPAPSPQSTDTAMATVKPGESDTGIAPAAHVPDLPEVNGEDEEEEDLFSGLAPLHDTGSVPIVGFEFPQDDARAPSAPTPSNPRSEAPTEQTKVPRPANAQRPGPPLAPGPFSVAVPPSQNDDAVRYVADRLNLSQEEAAIRLRRSPVIVARDVDRNGALTVSREIEKLGLKARVTRRVEKA